MARAQLATLDALEIVIRCCEEAGEEFDSTLTKAEASKSIDALRAKTHKPDTGRAHAREDERAS